MSHQHVPLAVVGEDLPRDGDDVCDTPGVTVATTVLNSVSLCTVEA
jgi:hypothetical protein